ncbi:hypothetical protein [Pseudorhodoferax sp.]|uniref:hypothetical protein n=1 Tax=Pseudorhodoferax sp. TaxID=1993553 RepID=UPI0039E3F651
MSSAMLHAVEAMPRNQSREPLADAAAAEAARYAVLRRLGSAIRHQIAGALQPVGMMATLLERRLKAPEPSMESLRRNSGELSTLSRAASAECVALMGWLAPREDEAVPLAAGVHECLHLMATELSFRGFSVADMTLQVQAEVSRPALRAVLPAALMALTDAAPSPAEVRIDARSADGTAVELELALLPQQGEPPPPAKAYRPIAWPDVQALAQAEGVGLECTGDRVVLRFAYQPRGAVN